MKYMHIVIVITVICSSLYVQATKDCRCFQCCSEIIGMQQNRNLSEQEKRKLEQKINFELDCHPRKFAHASCRTLTRIFNKK